MAVATVTVGASVDGRRPGRQVQARGGRADRVSAQAARVKLGFFHGATPMPYTPIVATLGYVLSPDRSEVLMIHRNARPDDQHLGKYNGLGGKMEPGEDIAACMRREILEEAGIECESMQLRGTLNWPGFGKHGEDWLGFIFVIDRYSGTPFTATPKARWSGWRWNACMSCRCGRATATSCRWCSTPIRGRSTA